MTQPDQLLCWKCGELLTDLPAAIGRYEICTRCRAELYVCRMCEFFDPLVSNSCREPVADVVNNKEMANFCGYYKIQPNAYHPPDKTARHTAQSQLADLFGVSAEPQDQSTGSAPDSETSPAKARLESLFDAKNSENH